MRSLKVREMVVFYVLASGERIDVLVYLCCMLRFRAGPHRCLADCKGDESCSEPGHGGKIRQRRRQKDGGTTEDGPDYPDSNWTCEGKWRRQWRLIQDPSFRQAGLKWKFSGSAMKGAEEATGWTLRSARLF
jgi:hypothetical protein